MEEGHRIKREVRLFRADDTMYMTLGYEARHSDWHDVVINEEGYRLSVYGGHGGEKIVTTYSMSWEAVAKELGFDACEYVINPDDTKCVLLYNYEEAD